jgi:hypothetical protein
VLLDTIDVNKADVQTRLIQSKYGIQIEYTFETNYADSKIQLF